MTPIALAQRAIRRYREPLVFSGEALLSAVVLFIAAVSAKRVVEAIHLARLDTTTGRVLHESLETLREMDSQQSVKRLIQLHTEGPVDNRAVYTDALLRRPSASLPVLLETLKSGRENLRVASVVLIGRFGTEAKFCIPDLLGCLDDESASVREHALAALGEINCGTDCLGGLARGLRDENAAVRAAAAMLAGSLAAEAEVVVVLLSERIRANDEGILPLVAWSLQRVASPERVLQALSALIAEGRAKNDTRIVVSGFRIAGELGAAARSFLEKAVAEECAAENERCTAARVALDRLTREP